MCGYFRVGVIDFMLKGKSLLDYKIFFPYNGYEKNDKIFSINKKMKKWYCVFCGKFRKLEKPEISYILGKY